MRGTKMIDASTPFGARVLKRLNDESIVWLTTVRRDGAPQLSPIQIALSRDLHATLPIQEGRGERIGTDAPDPVDLRPTLRPCLEYTSDAAEALEKGPIPDAR